MFPSMLSAFNNQGSQKIGLWPKLVVKITFVRKIPSFKKLGDKRLWLHLELPPLFIVHGQVENR